MTLEKSNVFYDEAISAHKGKHRTEGALGTFLGLIADGKVKPGSVLIVEALDRLSREDVLTSFTMFCSIITAGVDVVSLVNGEWFSRETLKNNLGQLYVAIGALWAANNFSELLSRRLSKAWGQKQKLAREEKRPMSSICPGWLRLSADKKSYAPIPERVKIVKLIFWLALRGWGKERIAKLFNRHLTKVPTWGVKGKKASAWHFSYIQKILTNPAVLGRAVLYTTRGLKPGEVRKPLGPALEGYYPQVIDQNTFLRVQMRNSIPRPRGPAATAANLFQGLLFDGDHPEFSMHYKDHKDPEGKWIYVVSDHRRKYPDEPVFSWNYNHLEPFLLNYLNDLDWSSLEAQRDVKVARFTKELSVKEADIEGLSNQIQRLVEVAKIADTGEVGKEMAVLNEKRDLLLQEAKDLRKKIDANRIARGDLAKELVRAHADRDNPRNRLRLREAIRNQVDRIELFRKLPKHTCKGVKIPVKKPGRYLSEFLYGAHCVRILVKGREKDFWVVRESDPWFDEFHGIAFDGPKVPYALICMLAHEDDIGS